MAKPKFSLTSDLVKVEPEPQTLNTQQAEEPQKIIKQEIEEKEAVNIKVSKKIKRDFQIMCFMKGITMTDAIEGAMKAFIEKHQ